MTYTLISDGSSDRALIPVIDWSLRRCGVSVLHAEWADLRRLRRPPKGLTERIRTGSELYPSDVIFVHRDAEGDGYEARLQEVVRAASTCAQLRIVPVIPVRMTEAWLLHDERAIRKAAGNPNGALALDMPKLADLENLPDPKKALIELIRQASGLRSRRLTRLNERECVHLVAEYCDSFEPLLGLSAFAEFTAKLTALTRAHPELCGADAS